MMDRPEPATRRSVPDLSGKVVGFIVTAVILLGTFLRLYRLDALPFWNDECLQLNGIMMTFKQLRPNHLFGIDHMPPLSYWIQRVFWLPFQSLYSARFPGAIAGILMVPVAYLFMRRVLNRFAGVAAALLTATSLYLVYYSQECRSYIFFGLAIWLFLGMWMDLMFGRSSARVAWWKWMIFSAFGLLCGAFHFAALVFLPTLGVLSSLILLWEYIRAGEDRDVKAVVWKWLGLFLSLGVACGLSYVLMRYSMGPKLSGMMEGAKNEWTAPRLSYLYRIFLAFSWGNGWRLILLLLVAFPAWLLGDTRLRRMATSVALLFVFSFIFSFYLFPLLGFRSTTGAFRYLFWCSWPLIMLPSLGAYAMAAFLPRRAAVACFAVLGVLYSLCQIPVFHHYHHMTAKRNNLNELKKDIEAIPGERLFVLCNSYDMHFMQFSWPTNCTFSSAPGFNTEVDYKRMGIDSWIESVADSFPDAIIKEGSNIHPTIRATFTNLVPSYGECLVVSNNVSDKVLFDWGISPMLGKPMTVVWNSDEDLVRLAALRKRDLVRFPGTMQLATTRNATGRFDLWRVLSGPQDITIIPSTASGPVSLALCVPQLAKGAQLLVETRDGRKQKLSLPAAETSLYDFRSRGWVSQPLTVQDTVRSGGRIPMKLNSRVINLTLPTEGGRAVVRLTPMGSALLIASVPPSTP